MPNSLMGTLVLDWHNTIGLSSCDDKNEEDDVITLDSYYGATIDEAFFFHPSFMRAGIFPTMSSQK